MLRWNDQKRTFQSNQNQTVKKIVNINCPNDRPVSQLLPGGNGQQAERNRQNTLKFNQNPLSNIRILVFIFISLRTLWLLNLLLKTFFKSLRKYKMRKIAFSFNFEVFSDFDVYVTFLPDFPVICFVIDEFNQQCKNTRTKLMSSTTLSSPWVHLSYAYLRSASHASSSLLSL